MQRINTLKYNIVKYGLNLQHTILHITMQYQLPNGKVINISINEYLNMTDDILEYYIASHAGETMNNPFTGSVLSENVKEKTYDFQFLKEEEESKEISFEDLSEDDIKNLEEM